MMCDEFLQKTGLNVTADYYETVIQPLYYAMPNKMIKDASAFCNWIKNVGLDMAEAVYDSYNTHASVVYESRLPIDLKHMENIKDRNIDLENRLAVYESVFSDEELRARLVAQLSTEDLIAARINRRD